jgi:hypothetical protein
MRARRGEAFQELIHEGTCIMKIKTKVKAGALSANTNQAVAKPRVAIREACRGGRAALL